MNPLFGQTTGLSRADRLDRVLLTVTTTHQPADELGYLPGKHPDRVHRAELGFGRAERLAGFDAAALMEVVEHVDHLRPAVFQK